MDQKTNLNIIQNTWHDDDDGYTIIEYFKEHNVPYLILSGDQIAKLKSVNIRSIFADTDVMSLLTKYRPPTYPDCFQKLYGRDIKLICWADLKSNLIKNGYNQCFVKPSHNNKAFDATIIRNKWNLNYVDSTVKSDTLVYYAPYVKFVNEYRIFVGKGKIYGIQESSFYVLKTDIISHKPPKSLLDMILKLNIYQFCVVDVAMLEDGKWCVVEINPPFSISSYDLDISTYIKYNQDALEYINKYEHK